jgi:hypothetical protein
MACSSPCYYVVDLDLPVIDIECTETDPDGKKITVSKSLPLFHGTVLKKEKEKDKYVFVQTLYADGHTIKLESVVIGDHIAPLATQPINIVTHKDTIRDAERLINIIYTGLSESDRRTYFATPEFWGYSKTLKEYVETWVEKPPIKNTACCAIAGGRRRPKKSRRSRSSRKRRQTRSK